MKAERRSAGRAAAVERFLELRPAVVARMQASIPAELRAELKPITLHQLQALSTLPAEGMTMHELASSLKISGATASALADRLVAQDLVRRATDPTDRRVVRLVPTAKGRSLARRHREAQRRAVAGLLNLLSDEQVAAWLDIMETLAASGKEADPGDTVPIRQLAEVSR
jgi:DNA-binding MarR family transcriptional regulator